jgi:hypothetical protein
LMGAYAKRLPSVTVEIVTEVAREFRLDMPSPLDGERKVRSKQGDAQQALNVLLDLFAALGNNEPTVAQSAVIEMSKK